MEKKPLSVTALTKYIKYKFDQDVHLKDILLEGEISNFKRNVRGHFYFTLKDDRASISAIMFKSNAQRVRFNPKDGMNILVRGYVSVFEAAGNYQVYISSMEEVGLGNLYQAYLQLKDKLEKEGYFSREHKQPLPRFPGQIAVLTSATGAAVRDIIHIINRRYPLVKIVVYPTTVQGENAKHEIVENIEKAGMNKENDVIILGRGGGSIEDLWAFNEEMVAKAIYDCPVPIISAVGHETDFTIADFVADERAPTPSGAAEIAVPDKRVLLDDLHRTQKRFGDSLERKIRELRREVSNLTERYVIKDPSRLLEPKARLLDNLTHRLQTNSPKKRLDDAYDKLERQTDHLFRTYRRLLEIKSTSHTRLTDRLRVVNPRLIVEQGYTLTKKDGRIIKSVKDTALGDVLEMEFKDGNLKVEVLDKKEKNNNG